MVDPNHPLMKAVSDAYEQYIDTRDSEAVATLRARADLAEAILKARKGGISIPTQSVVLGLDRTWVYRLSKGSMRPPSRPAVAMSRVIEGTIMGNSDSEWQAIVDGKSIEEALVEPPPPPPELKETVIIPKIPDCRYCNNKATRVIQYGNGKTAMVCEKHAPPLEG